MKVFYVLVLVLVAGAVPSHGRTESEGTVFKKTQPHESMNNVTVSSSKLETYSYLYLAMQWPRSFCSSRQCYRPVPNHFTVHGLWPQYDPSIYRGGIDCRMPIYGPYPRFSNRRLNANLLTGLNKYWPDLTTMENNQRENNNQWFWAAEYNKHGSCTFNNENDYFTLTLTMVHHLGDLISMLSRIRGPIIPGKRYWPSHIINAVREVTHKMPALRCILVGKKIQLLEIRFCAQYSNSNPVLIDCIFYSDCGENQMVYFPGP